MISKYDYDNNCRVYTCKVCGHTYTEYLDYEKELSNEGKPFVKMEEPLLHTVSMSWEPDRIERIFHYACPMCGVLQIDVGSI